MQGTKGQGTIKQGTNMQEAKEQGTNKNRKQELMLVQKVYFCQGR
jgi:hypothetical protein